MRPNGGGEGRSHDQDGGDECHGRHDPASLAHPRAAAANAASRSRFRVLSDALPPRIEKLVLLIVQKQGNRILGTVDTSAIVGRL